MQDTYAIRELLPISNRTRRREAALSSIAFLAVLHPIFASVSFSRSSIHYSHWMLDVPSHFCNHRQNRANTLNPGAAFFSCSCCTARLPCRASSLAASAGSVTRHVLGSCLPLRATNSSRKGSNLWGVGESPVPSRRRAHCRTRDGHDSLRKRHSLASRRWRTRKNPHPRALRFLTEKTPRKRRCQDCRIAYRPETPSLETSEKIRSETQFHAETYS